MKKGVRASNRKNFIRDIIPGRIGGNSDCARSGLCQMSFVVTDNFAAQNFCVPPISYLAPLDNRNFCFAESGQKESSLFLSPASPVLARSGMAPAGTKRENCEQSQCSRLCARERIGHNSGFARPRPRLVRFSQAQNMTAAFDSSRRPSSWPASRAQKLLRSFYSARERNRTSMDYSTSS